jgi:hypothetical protein
MSFDVKLLPERRAGKSNLEIVRSFNSEQERADWVTKILATHPKWKVLWDHVISMDERSAAEMFQTPEEQAAALELNARQVELARSRGFTILDS